MYKWFHYYFSWKIKNYEIFGGQISFLGSKSFFFKIFKFYFRFFLMKLKHIQIIRVNATKKITWPKKYGVLPNFFIYYIKIVKTFKLKKIPGFTMIFVRNSKFFHDFCTKFQVFPGCFQHFSNSSFFLPKLSNSRFFSHPALKGSGTPI